MKHYVLVGFGTVEFPRPQFIEVESAVDGYGIFAYFNGESYSIVHAPSGLVLTTVLYENEVATWIAWAENHGLGEMNAKSLLKHFRQLTSQIFPDKDDEEIARMYGEVKRKFNLIWNGNPESINTFPGLGGY